MFLSKRKCWENTFCLFLIFQKRLYAFFPYSVVRLTWAINLEQRLSKHSESAKEEKKTKKNRVCQIFPFQGSLNFIKFMFLNFMQSCLRILSYLAVSTLKKERGKKFFINGP